MGIKWGESLKRGISFGVKPKRWLQMFIVDFVFALLTLGYAINNLSQLMFTLSSLTGSVAFTSLFTFGAVFIIMFVLWWLVRILVTGALIQQSNREKDRIKDVYSFMKERYLHLLLFTIIFTILNSLANLVPSVGTVLSFAVVLLLFFGMQIVIIDKKDPVEAMKGSYQIFQNQIRPLVVSFNWKFVVWVLVLLTGAVISVFTGMESVVAGLTVFIVFAFFSWVIIYSKIGDMWALVTIITMVITGIFAMPLMFLLLNLFMAGGTGVQAIAAILMMLKTNMASVVAGLAIFLIGTSIAGTFSLKTVVEYYKQVRKRKLI